MLHIDSLVHWLHLMAAVLWVGSMFCVSLVIYPVLRSHLAPEYRLAVFQEIGRRYLPIQWGCWAVLAATGIFKVMAIGGASGLIDSRFGIILGLKLAMVSAMVALSLLHSYAWGPRLNRLGADHPNYRQLAKRMAFWGKVNLFLVSGIVFCGAMLVMGD